MSSTTPFLAPTPLSPTASPTSASSASLGQTQWESYRKQCRLLETQIYKKLQELAQIQTRLMNEGRTGPKSNARIGRAGERETTSTTSSNTSSTNSSAASSPSNSSTLIQYETCSTELTDLLRSFTDTNDGLTRLLTEYPSLNTESNNYIITKNRTLVHENQLEFKRTKQNIQAAIARTELMSGASARHAAADPSLRGRTEQLLREEKSLNHSLRMTDEVLSQAMSARDTLYRGRAMFQGVGQKLTKLGAAFPVIGQLLTRINCKHQRDMIVLACVIAGCMIFTFIYIMSKP